MSANAIYLSKTEVQPVLICALPHYIASNTGANAFNVAWVLG